MLTSGDERGLFALIRTGRGDYACSRFTAPPPPPLQVDPSTPALESLSPRARPHGCLCCFVHRRALVSPSVCAVWAALSLPGSILLSAGRWAWPPSAASPFQVWTICSLGWELVALWCARPHFSEPLPFPHTSWVANGHKSGKKPINGISLLM